MMIHASGRFDVQLSPLPLHDTAAGAQLARLAIDKQFHGDLTATGKGEMLSSGTLVPDSAGYVAIEQVTGTLHGRSGSFVFQHNGTMKRGAAQLSLTVVPDSGTGELVGLAGTMAIEILDGVHFYAFDYSLSERAVPA